MLYGIADISRNLVGRSANSHKLRKKEFWAVDNVSFKLKKGETLGIIGPNGSGKSTLLKMLNGIFWPDKGIVSVKGRVGALIEVGAGFHPMLSGRENIYINGAIMGMSKNEIQCKFDDIVNFADIGDFLDTPVKNYSSGMFVRLGFAVAVHCDPDILLIDEILAVGDFGFQNKCFNRIGELKKRGTTTILVSHNMHTVSTFSEQVLLLNKGKARAFNQVSEGIGAYSNLFSTTHNQHIEQICSGSEEIDFFCVNIKSRKLFPGESFEISLKYKAIRDFPDIDIDTAIYSGSDPGLYFQATNRSFQKRINLKKGKNGLDIAIHEIPINSNPAKIIVSIWSKGRNNLLFWWRIPVEFSGVPLATGKNFLKVSYQNMGD